jgi:hypothetical protein
MLLLDIGAVPTVRIFVFSFYDVVIRYCSCSNSVVFLLSLSTMLLLNIGAVERGNKNTTLLEQLQYLITTS